MTTAAAETTTETTQAAETTQQTTPVAETTTTQQAATTTETAQSTATTAVPDASAKVPDSYALTLPKDSPITAENLKAFEAEAKSLELSNDQAQKALQTRHDWIVGETQRQAQELADLKADPTLGGAQYDTTIKHVTDGLQWAFGDDAVVVRKLFDTYGLGNSKVLVRGLAKIGRALQEDHPNVGGGNRFTHVDRKPTEEVLFPSSASR
jgi:hypothetical protein